jgi:hypothetical protein
VRGERRFARFGLASACVLLVTTLTILYRGSRDGAVAEDGAGGGNSVARGPETRTNGDGALRYAAFAK